MPDYDKAIGSATATNSSATSFTITGTAALTKGARALCAVQDDGVITGCTDNLGNTWTQVASVQDSQFVTTTLFHTRDSTGGTPTITVSYSSAPFRYAAQAFQLTGAGALDVSKTNTGATTAALTTGTSAATAQAAEIAICIFGTFISSGAASTTTLGGSYTLISSLQAPGDQTDTLTTGYLVLTATGTQVETATASIAQDSYAALLVTYVGVGGSAYMVRQAVKRASLW